MVLPILELPPPPSAISSCRQIAISCNSLVFPVNRASPWSLKVRHSATGRNVERIMQPFGTGGSFILSKSQLIFTRQPVLASVVPEATVKSDMNNANAPRSLITGETISNAILDNALSPSRYVVALAH